MFGAYVIAGIAFLGIFILFTVIGKTLSNTVNHLVKIDYLLRKEYDLKKERIEVRRIFEEDQEDSEPGEDD